MKRLRLHVGVPDLAQSIRFYNILFDAPSTVVKDQPSAAEPTAAARACRGGACA
ncbi:MAG TPA: hypothetical protein VHZ26_08145 [Caulobacteraceae bacterium]|nr:hypothetical protein [Caulobacteraceae bacterium]